MSEQFNRCLYATRKTERADVCQREYCCLKCKRTKTHEPIGVHDATTAAEALELMTVPTTVSNVLSSIRSALRATTAVSNTEVFLFKEQLRH